MEEDFFNSPERIKELLKIENQLTRLEVLLESMNKKLDKMLTHSDDMF